MLRGKRSRFLIQPSNFNDQKTCFTSDVNINRPKITLSVILWLKPDVIFLFIICSGNNLRWNICENRCQKWLVLPHLSILFLAVRRSDFLTSSVCSCIGDTRLRVHSLSTRPLFCPVFILPYPSSLSINFPCVFFSAQSRSAANTAQPPPTFALPPNLDTTSIFIKSLNVNSSGCELAPAVPWAVMKIEQSAARVRKVWEQHAQAVGVNKVLEPL